MKRKHLANFFANVSNFSHSLEKSLLFCAQHLKLAKIIINLLNTVNIELALELIFVDDFGLRQSCFSFPDECLYSFCNADGFTAKHNAHFIK